MLLHEIPLGGPRVKLVYPHGWADAPGDIDQVPMMGAGII
jgi:hypothetical protein